MPQRGNTWNQQGTLLGQVSTIIACFLASVLTIKANQNCFPFSPVLAHWTGIGVGHGGHFVSGHQRAHEPSSCWDGTHWPDLGCGRRGQFSATFSCGQLYPWSWFWLWGAFSGQRWGCGWRVSARCWGREWCEHCAPHSSLQPSMYFLTFPFFFNLSNWIGFFSWG